MPGGPRARQRHRAHEGTRPTASSNPLQGAGAASHSPAFSIEPKRPQLDAGARDNTYPLRTAYAPRSPKPSPGGGRTPSGQTSPPCLAQHREVPVPRQEKPARRGQRARGLVQLLSHSNPPARAPGGRQESCPQRARARDQGGSAGSSGPPSCRNHARAQRWSHFYLHH